MQRRLWLNGFQAVAPALLTAAAAAQPNVGWVRHYDGPVRRLDRALAVAHGPGGTVAVAGSSEGLGSGEDYATVKYDAAGNVLWTARFTGSGSQIDRPAAIAMDAAGNVYVTGQSWAGLRPANGEWDYITIKYHAATGQALWTRRYNGPGNWSDTVTGLVVDAGGNAYLSGFAFKEPDQFNRYATHFHVLKYDPDGTVAWEHLIDAPTHLGAGARSVTLGRDGNIYATGVVNGGDPWNNDDNILTAKINPGGQLVYAVQYTSPGFNSGLDDGHLVTADAQGNAYVAGQTYDTENNRTWDTTVLKYDAGGGLVWTSVLPLSRPDGPTGIDLDAAGNIYVGGVWNNDLDDDGFVVSFSPSGQERWRRIIDEPEWWDQQAILGLKVGFDGNIYAAGEIQYESGYDNTLFRYTTGGDLLDRTRVDGGSNSDLLYGFDLAPDNTAYLAGSASLPLSLTDFLTIRINAGSAAPCYANCDGSTAAPILNVNDFVCFQTLFAAGDSRANCDGSTNPPVLNVNDFICFQTAFAAGCP